MAKLTPEGERIVEALAAQYKIGVDAVRMMLDAVAQGGGSMAKFNVPEFGGGGEWLRGGMPAMGDMAASSMRATVDSLCSELSNLMAAQGNLFTPGGQWPVSWWPAELGEPSLAGARQSTRYAYFAPIRRLAVDTGRHIEVYDTTGFAIEGLLPGAGQDGPLTFASNRGPVRLDSFPRVHGMAQEARTAPGAEARAAGDAPAQEPATDDASSILALIERLGALKEKGILTEEEFAAKKAELLSRL
jgi:hypothetical protein